VLAYSNIDASGWICFGLGALTFAIGLGLGAWNGVKEAEKATRQQLKTKVDLAVGKVSDLTAKAVDAANAEGKDPAVAAAATATGAATEGAVKDIEGLLNVLPAPLRFAGFLMLVGAFVMSVGTVQFGGHSIF
jgi:hypothetical protein